MLRPFWPEYRSSFASFEFFRAAVFACVGASPAGRLPAESAFAVPGNGHPSAHALSWLRRLQRAVRLCAGRADDALSGGEVDSYHTPLDHGDLALFDLRHLSRCALGLFGARLGRLLGLGPGGKCLADAVAHRHRISAFGDDAGKTRHDEELERLADLLHLRAFHLRHAADAVGTG